MRISEIIKELEKTKSYVGDIDFPVEIIEDTTHRHYYFDPKKCSEMYDGTFCFSVEEDN